MNDDSYIEGGEALYEAAIAGDAEAISKLELRADIVDRHGETILHNESENGNTERVRFILREFAHKNLLTKLNKYEQTALQSAYVHTEVAEILIDAARHLPNNYDNSVTSFQAFLRHADVTLNTTLHRAASWGNASLVKLIVNADPSDTHFQNDEGKTPMYIAVEEGFNDIAEIISTTCTAPSLDGPDGSIAMRIDDQGKSPGGPLYKIMDKYAFCVAAIAGDADAMAKLEMQADILNLGEETILDVASQNRYAERVRFILREFAKKNLLATLVSDKHTALQLATAYGDKHIALHLAAIYGHTEMAEILIDAARYLPPPLDNYDNAHDNSVASFQAFLRQTDEMYLNTALHRAVMNGHASIVKLLVEADPTDTHIQNREGKTPMYIAVEEGFNDIVEIISTTCTAPSLDGPDGSVALRITNLDQVKSPGGTLYKILDEDALYAASIAGDADAISILEMRADIVDINGDTILHKESKNGNTERVQFILRVFAHKNLLAKLNEYEQTALQSAYIHTEVAEILIDAARHLPPPSDNYDNSVASFQAFLRHADASLNTALHRAASWGNASLVKLLVEADPDDTHIQNSEGKTPMYIAVEEGFNDVAEIIFTTCTALSLDGPSGSIVMRITNLDQVNSPGGTLYKILDKDALYAASISGDVDAISELEMRADIVDEYGDTILHNESENGNTEHVRFILREFAHKNLLAKLNKYERTALQEAYINTEVAEILIDAARHLPPPLDNYDNPVTSFQAFLRHADTYLNTTLHRAANWGNASLVKLLVNADPSDTHFQNAEGKTPMYIAVEEGFNDIVEIISTTCIAPSLDGPDGSIAMRIDDQGKSPGGPLYKIMDKYAFCVAAIAGDADAMAKLEMQADILNLGEETILHVASQNRYSERVRIILREFAKKNLLATLVSDKHTALHLATAYGEKHIALHLAAIYGHTEMAEILIDAARHLPPPLDNYDNAHDNSVTSFQAFLRQADEMYMNTALHRAVMNSHASIVKLIVEADPGDTHIQNSEGKTPMYIAVEEGFNDIAEIISTTCTAPSLDGPDGSTVLRITNLDQVESPGGTLYKILDKDALYAASIAGDADAISELETRADTPASISECNQEPMHCIPNILYMCFGCLLN